MFVQNNKNRQLAVGLRRSGKSYGEISSLLGISKSTLSYWLHALEITNSHRLSLLKKQQKGRIKGAQKRKDLRIRKEKLILTKAANEIHGLSKRELWLLGTIAYWCEGSKQKANNVSGRVIFANSDPFLAKLFVKWLREICNIPDKRLIYTLYIHETGNIEQSFNYWSQILGVDRRCFTKVVLKKHNISTNRKYDNSSYFGLLRVVVRNSTDLNRQIKGWINGISSFLN